jgi:hypothetical protein
MKICNCVSAGTKACENCRNREHTIEDQLQDQDKVIKFLEKLWGIKNENNR